MKLFLIFSTAANAVLPVVLLIFVGYCLRRIGLMTEDFAKNGNKLVFNVFLPVTFFINVYNMEGLSSITWDIVLYGCAMVFVLFCLGFGIAAVTTKAPERRGVIVQASFRSNMAIIGLSLAAATGGDEAVATASMISAFSVALFNVLAVFSFSAFSPDTQGSAGRLKSVFARIVKIPMIVGIALGMAVLVIRELQISLFGECVISIQRDLKIVYTALNNIKSITTPFALLIMGGQFVFSAVKSYRREIVVGVLARIVIAPAVGLGMAVVLDRMGWIPFGPDEYPALIALFGSPVAVSSPIMASQMGGDEQLATQLVVWTSIGSIFTVFATVCILMAAGLIAV